jgi:hypothetical protein
VRRLAFFLPVIALLWVSLTAALVYFSGDNRDGSEARPRRASEIPAETPTPETLRPRLQPGQTVCQSILHAPDPGQPRVFADIYTQVDEASGIAIVATEAVSAEAFEEARKTIERMFRGNDLGEPLIEQQAYVIIIERGKGVLDQPEFACLEERYGEGFFDRICGIADRADYPVATVNEADLLGERRGPCGGLNILYHELAHLVQNRSLPPPDYFDVKEYYARAMSAGKYKDFYANTNPNEYFAEAVQAYFLSTDPRGRYDRDWLEAYDPEIYTLVERVFGP